MFDRLADGWAGGRRYNSAKAVRNGDDMSTPEERLRKRAQDAMQNPPETPAQRASREQQEMRQVVQRVRRVGQAYLTRAEALIAETRLRIFHELRYSQPGTAAGFTLHVGHYPVVQATIQDEGWHVTVRNKGTGVSNYDYTSDEAFLAAMDKLIEPLVGSAIDLLTSGQEPPAPDAYGRL